MSEHKDDALPGAPDPDEVLTMAVAPVLDAATLVVERLQAWRRGDSAAMADEAELDRLEAALSDLFRVYDALADEDRDDDAE